MRLIAAAIAIEKALELASQHKWTTIEIGTHDSQIIAPLSNGHDKLLVAPIIEQCISFKQHFAYCIFRQVVENKSNRLCN